MSNWGFNKCQLDSTSKHGLDMDAIGSVLTKISSVLMVEKNIEIDYHPKCVAYKMIITRTKVIFMPDDNGPVIVPVQRRTRLKPTPKTRRRR